MPESIACAGKRVVDLRRVNLDTAEADETGLSPDERDRAARFVFERDRRRYVAGRTALRRCLAERLGVSPDGLRFAYNACGKPSLGDAHGTARELAFNLSHSGGLCVIAVSEGKGEIGIDIERVGAFEPVVAEEAFSAAECREIAALPEAGQGLAFARCWTRKEAFIKALGLGFSYPSREVTVSTGAQARVLACRADAGRAEDWRLLTFEPGNGFAGAIAVREGEGSGASRRGGG